MSSIVFRHVLRSVSSATVLVVLAMTLLFSLFTLLSELNDVGVADYDLTAMFSYLLLTMPRRIVEIMPVCCLIGCLIGLGQLSNNSELTALRAAGVSVARIARISVGAAMLFAAIAFLVGEFVVPDAQVSAKSLKANATRSLKDEQQHRKNIWVKKQNEFAKIEFVSADHRLLGVHIYQFDDQFQLRSYTHAENGHFKSDNLWVLNNVKQTTFGSRSTSAALYESLDWVSLIEVDSLGLIVDEPDEMSIRDLSVHNRFLESVGRVDQRFELAMWQKTLVPFSTIAMVLLALPLVFGSARQVPLTQRVFTGILIGLVFNIVTRGIGYTGLAYGLNVPLLTILPPLLIMALATTLLMRVR